MKIGFYNIFRNIVAAGAVLLAVGCQNNDISVPDAPQITDGALTVTGSLAIPDMPVLNSRGNMGDNPNTGLKLTVLEFDLASTAAQSFITNVYQAEVKTTTGANTVTFDITLNAATTPKVLHLMIANDYITVPAEGGSIASLLPTLSVGSETSQTEAYWGCVEFPDGFTKTGSSGNPELRDDVKEKLTNVPVIRNFAKITVTNRAANFEVIGFDVVSCPTSGTVAPWNASKQAIPALISGNTMKSYADISSSAATEEGLPYSGVLPANVGFRNQESDAKGWENTINSNMRSPGPKYLYEHPYEPTRRTYLIINGNYNNGSDIVQGFYKIDIGNLKADGSFDYYNIIRNINYNIIIQEVLAQGTETVADAIARAPFNNLLAATETSTALNVSDGKNMLIVDDVNHIIVNSGEEVKILYRYITNVTSDKTVANDVPAYIVGDGDVIQKNAAGEYDITKKNITQSGAEWVELTVKTNAPDEYETKEQTVTIVDGKGLGRTITLVLRQPWTYQKIGGYDAIIAPGAQNLYGSDLPSSPQNFSNAAGAAMTVYFNLPDGIPDAVFPLDFTLEARYKDLENNKIGTLLVTSGSSLFDQNVTAIQYVKTVSLMEYKYQYKGIEDSSDFDTGKANTSHTIRCRFLTISSVENGSDAEIKIHNQYFTPDADVSCKRVTNP